MAILLDILAAGVVDGSGAVLDSGSVYVYQLGTTTKQDVFQDTDLAVPHSNPLTLDSAGRAEAYVSAPVKLIIEDSSGTETQEIEQVGEAQSLDGDVTVGTDTSNFFKVNSLIKSDLIPQVSSTYDLGSSGRTWDELYADDVKTTDITISGSSHTLSSGFANQVVDDYTRTTGTSVGVRGVGISTSSGSFTTASATYVDVTNLSVTITTSGRPVYLFLSNAGGSFGYVGTFCTSGAAIALTAWFKLVRDSTDIGAWRIILIQDSVNADTGDQITVPQGAIAMVDDVAAGTYVYKLQARVTNAANERADVAGAKLVAFEL